MWLLRRLAFVVVNLVASVALTLVAGVLVGIVALPTGAYAVTFEWEDEEYDLMSLVTGLASLATFIGYWIWLFSRSRRASPATPPTEQPSEVPRDSDSTITRMHQH